MKVMSQSIDSTVQMVRRIATELRPSIWDDLGLAAAIEWQLGEFQERTGIRCDMTLQLDESALDEPGRIALFRIFQETLTNVAPHAPATARRGGIRQGPAPVHRAVTENRGGV